MFFPTHQQVQPQTSTLEHGNHIQPKHKARLFLRVVPQGMGAGCRCHEAALQVPFESQLSFKAGNHFVFLHVDGSSSLLMALMWLKLTGPVFLVATEWIIKRTTNVTTVEQPITQRQLLAPRRCCVFGQQIVETIVFCLSCHTIEELISINLVRSRCLRGAVKWKEMNTEQNSKAETRRVQCHTRTPKHKETCLR